MSCIIRVLSEQTINQIAAGEVIEHPSSVIKELVENSIDAKAKNIRVEVVAGGFASMIVSDDGCGMSQDDALLCLERHATSKIRKVDDLFSIETMGFRGEALASIAAISKLTLITSLHEEGVKVVCEGGRLLESRTAPRKRGTTIEVRSLFYTTPARKKFQKSPGQSLSDIHRLLQILALSRPDISFKLIADNTTYLDVASQTLTERISHILGKAVFSDLIKVEFSEGPLILKGMISNVHFHKPTRAGQYLFVNQRAVEAKEVSLGALSGYGMMLDKGRYPLFVLHMQLEGSLFDVNVHPQKKEIRFKEQQGIKELVSKAVKKALFSSTQVQPSKPFVDTDRCVSEELIFSTKKNFAAEEIKHFDVKEFAKPEQNEQLILCESMIAPSIEDWIFIGLFKHFAFIDKTKAMLLDRAPYLSEKEGFLMIDLRAARSRVFYEKWQETKKVAKQSLLFPVKLELPLELARHMEASFAFFDEIGFGVRKMGKALYVIDEVMWGFPEEDIKESVISFLEEMLEGKEHLEKKKEKIMIALFMKAAMKGAHETIQEAKILLTKLLKTKNPFFSPQGKKIIAEVSKENYEKLF